MQQWMYRTVLCMVLFMQIGTAIGNAVPSLPMVVNGTVYINGEPAPAGTEIKAMIDGEVSGSYVISEKGLYGMTVEYRPGSNSVDFYVDGIKSGSIEWSDRPSTLNLAITSINPTVSSQTKVANDMVGISSMTANATVSAISTVTATVYATVTATPQRSDMQKEDDESQEPQKQNAVKSLGFDALIMVFSVLLASYAIIGGRRT